MSLPPTRLQNFVDFPRAITNRDGVNTMLGEWINLPVAVNVNAGSNGRSHNTAGCRINDLDRPSVKTWFVTVLNSIIIQVVPFLAGDKPIVLKDCPQSLVIGDYCSER